MQQNVNERVLFILNYIEGELGADKLSTLLRRIGASTNKPEAASISIMQQATLLREACKMAGSPTFAARMGTQMQEAHTLSAYVAQSSPTLRAAFVNASRFYKLVDPTLSLGLEPDGDNEAMVVRASEGALLRHHRYMEFLIYALLTRLRALAGAKLYPQYIRFAHEMATDVRSFEQLAGCTVLFGSDFNGLVFSKSTLDMAFRDHDPELVSYLSQLGTEMLSRSGKSPRDIIARCERYIIRSLPGTMPGADQVAEALGMSRRTLARQLKDKGTSFREVTERIRFDIAKTYLADGLSISEIAYYLGYADHAAFSTAFRRWAGTSPREFRKREAN
ncbi:MAG: AraC family transcriptional regulator ligand-binding domain-containing protein [Paracoccaceae bacterium]